MGFVAIGDVGAIDGEYHAGDEAMLEALLDQLRARGLSDWTVISAAPSETSQRYGVSAIDRIGFDHGKTPSVDAREARLASVLAMARDRRSERDWQDPAHAVIDAIAASEGVVIAGGGNLSSIWPEHVYERAAIAGIAAIVGRPLIVSGQTIGPALTARDGELVSEILTSAVLVGLRESDSLRLAQELGVPRERIRLTVDDAMFMKGDSEAELPIRPYCLLTVAPYAGGVEPSAFYPLVARVAERLQRNTGLDLLLVPHQSSLYPSVVSGDRLVNRTIAQMLPDIEVGEAPQYAARTIAEITRRASLIVSTRYHPVVFGSSMGVPTVGVGVDEYTSAKIGGALGHVGLAEFAVPSIAALTGDLDKVVDAAWGGREQIRAESSQARSVAKRRWTSWWDDTASVLSGEPAPARTVKKTTPHSYLPSDLVAALDVLRGWQGPQDRSRTALALAAQGLRDELSARSRELLEVERLRGAEGATLGDLERQLEETEFALQAAHRLASEVAEPIFATHLGAGPHSMHAAELHALQNTRTFRYTRSLRRVYGRLRRIARDVRNRSRERRARSTQ